MFKILIFMTLLLMSQSTVGQSKVFYAGASAVDVTPFLGVGIVGDWNTPAAENIHDPLFVKALVLDDGLNKLVFVIVDNLGIPAELCEKVKEMIREETDIMSDRIMITATHTHSGPSAGGIGDKRRDWNYGKPFDEYQVFLMRRITDAVKIAVRNLRPANIAWGSYDKPQHVFNRRWMMKEQVVNPFGLLDSVKMNPGYLGSKIKPVGPIDPEVSFLAVASKEGKPIAVLANYSLHYVGGIPSHDISADYFGAFAKRLTSLLKAEEQDIPFVGIMSNGTSGDINNFNFAMPEKSYLPYAKINGVADDIAQGLIDVYKQLEFKEWVPLKASAQTILLKVRKPTAEMVKNMEKIKQHDPTNGVLYHPMERTYVNRVTQQANSYPDSLAATIQAFSIGDLAIGGIPFAVFAETGLKLKAENPFQKSFTIGIANGYWGYLPTPIQHRKGGYETWLSTNKVQEDASDIIVGKLLKLFRQIKE